MLFWLLAQCSLMHATLTETTTTWPAFTTPTEPAFANVLDPSWVSPYNTSLDLCGNASQVLSANLATAGSSICSNPPSTIEDLEKVMLELVAALDNHSPQTVPMVYIGCDNNNFYGLVDCWGMDYGVPADCRREKYPALSIQKWMVHRWKLKVKAPEVLGDDKRHSIAFIDGKIDLDSKFLEGDYQTTERPWYSQDDGWGDAYQFAQSPGSCSIAYGTTITKKVTAGTAGIDNLGVCRAGTSETIPFKWGGWDSCNSTIQCGDGEGDCSEDGDCAGDLVCWKREQGATEIPWNTGTKAYDTSSFNAMQFNNDVQNIGNADFCVSPEVSTGLETTEILMIIFGTFTAVAIIIYALSVSGILESLRHAFMGDMMLALIFMFWKALDLSSTFVAFFVEINPIDGIDDWFRVSYIVFAVCNFICFALSMYFLYELVSFLWSHNEGINTAQVHRQKFQIQMHVDIVGMISFVFEDTFGSFLQVIALKLYPETVTWTYLACVAMQLIEMGMSITSFASYQGAIEALELADEMAYETKTGENQPTESFMDRMKKSRFKKAEEAEAK